MQGAKAGPVSSPLQHAQEFFAAQRRPVLLGVAFLAIVTTFGNIGGFVGPYGTGLLVAEFGNFKYALLAIAIGYFAAFAILALCQTSVLGMHRVSRASLSNATIERA